MTALTGNAITVYAQHEVVKDLIQARIEAGGAILFDVQDTTIHNFDSKRPLIQFEKDGTAHELPAILSRDAMAFMASAARLFPRVF